MPSPLGLSFLWVFFIQGLIAATAAGVADIERLIPWEGPESLLEPSEPYDEAVALHMLLYSSIAYMRKDHVEEWNFEVRGHNAYCGQETQGFNLMKAYYSPTEDGFGYMGIDHGEQRIVVAFRGTTTKEDWLENLAGGLHYTPSCLMPESPFGVAPGATDFGNVHRGFCYKYQYVADQGLPDDVYNLHLEYPDYKIYVTGHSLGAALASLCATDLGLRYGIDRDTLLMYNYGGPRLGDPSFVRLLNAHVGTVYRVVHAGDVVVHAAPCCVESESIFLSLVDLMQPNPFPCSLLTFAIPVREKTCPWETFCPIHTSTEVFYPVNMEVGAEHHICSTHTGEDPSCSYSKRDLLDLSIDDHVFYFERRVGRYCKGWLVPDE
ncbi:unnamed protein product [Chrysoparadoxa australica]